ncbi:hypothetical protein F0U59_51885 [Archangium gephyra]|nr:hypothetical protein F0U59_51885 [Archangium gephyra]
MKLLSELPSCQFLPLPKGARHAVEIREPKSNQALVITSREPLAAYQLDLEEKGVKESKWVEGENHPDGVVLGRIGIRTYVCFIELKSSMKIRKDKKPPPAEHALEQLKGGIEHFHPFEATGRDRSHGDEHHDEWRAGEDALDFLPDADHEVIGIAVGFRHAPRPPPLAPLLNMGDKRVMRVVVPIHGAQANQATIPFDDLLRRAGILP